MHAISIIAVIALIAADQLAKRAAVLYLEPIGSYPLINNVFELHFVMNEGASFGMMQGGRWFFVAATPVVLLFIVVYYIKLPEHKPYNWVRASLVMVFAGAVGNFVDRARQGYVVDYFYAKFINFPVFNIADMMIVIGTFIFVAVFIFFIRDEAKARDDGVVEVTADDNSEQAGLREQ